MDEAPLYDETYLPNVRSWEDYYKAKVGFRNYWYAAAFSKEIEDGDHLARTILGEEILFRRIAGKVYAMHDRCIHRGVKLSDQVDCHTDSTISCWWHGFTFRWSDGLVTDIVGAPSSGHVGKARIKVYPVEEAQGMIFVFIGDKGVEVPPLANHVPPGFLDENRVLQGEMMLVPSNWRLGPEGGLDEIHRYLHRTSTLLLDTKMALPLGHEGIHDQCEIVEDESGPKGIIDRFAADTSYFEVPIDGGAGKVTGLKFASTNPDLDGEVRRKRTVATSCWLPGVLRVEGFTEEGGAFYEFYVPVDANSYRGFMVISQICPTEEETHAFNSRFMTRWRPHALRNFLQQDNKARISAHGSYAHDRFWVFEKLCREDYMLMEWRRLAARHSTGVQTPEHMDVVS